MSEVFLGIAKPVLVAGVVGGAVGMVLGTGRIWERLVRGMVGVACAYVGHHVAAKMMGGILDIILDPPWVPTVEELDPVGAFLVGLVGMVACQAAINAMTAVRDKADDYVGEHMDGGK